MGSDEKDENLQVAYDEANKDFDSIDLFDALKELRFPDGKLIWKELPQIVHERSIREKLAPGLYRKRLEDVGKFLEKINGTFKKARQIFANEWFDDVRGQEIWHHQPEERLAVAGKTSRPSDAGPINQTFRLTELVECVAFYLSRPWMQHNGLDWVFLDALVFSGFEETRETMYSGILELRINWAYVWSGGDIEKMLWWRLLLEWTKWTLRFPLPLGIIVTLLYFQYERAALFIAVPYGIYLLIRLAHWPSRFSVRREAKKIKEKAGNYLDQMGLVYNYCQTPVINPRALNAQLDKAQEKGVPFHPAVFALLDGILSRHPSVFMPFVVGE